MATELTTIEHQASNGRAVVVYNPTAHQVDLIRRTLCAELTPDEFDFAIAAARRFQLDPLARQIYFIKRAGKLTIQTSIDGYRLIARRTGKYRGQVGPLWCGADAKWLDVWLDEGPPLAAKVGVLHGDFDEPLWAVARWSSYYPKEPRDRWMWDKMPDGQLAKCAESLALRRAFPYELSGLYIEEEMAQAANDPPRSRPTSAKPAQNARQAPPPSKQAMVQRFKRVEEKEQMLGLANELPPTDDAKRLEQQLGWREARVTYRETALEAESRGIAFEALPERGVNARQYRESAAQLQAQIEQVGDVVTTDEEAEQLF